MTRGDQLKINTAYASIRDALNALAQVRQKDNYIAHMLRTLYAMEDTIHEYVAPIGRAAK